MSDDDQETLQLDFAVEANKSWTTLEDEDMDRIERLAAELRERPLMPPMPADATTHWPECTSGIAFPCCHCAVRGCATNGARLHAPRGEGNSADTGCIAQRAAAAEIAAWPLGALRNAGSLDVYCTPYLLTQALTTFNRFLEGFAASWITSAL